MTSMVAQTIVVQITQAVGTLILKPQRLIPCGIVGVSFSKRLEKQMPVVFIFIATPARVLLIPV
jgi:hypothetical protein